LLDFIAEQVGDRSYDIARLNVRDLPAQALVHADFSDSKIVAAQQAVAAARAIVIATPVYKAAYSGLLKTFLDLLPQTGLTGKWVLPLATGGSPAHMLAMDYALRPVLTSLSAQHVFPGIYATDQQVQWSVEQGLQLADDLEQRLLEGSQRLLDSLDFLSADQRHPDKDLHGVARSVPFSAVRCSV
jgi:FMN reductase